MSDATDVLRAIDQLRRDLSGYHGQLKAHNDLQRHCDNQRKRITELEGLYAKAKAENEQLKADNTMYRTRFADSFTRLLNERDELRELVRDLWNTAQAAARVGIDSGKEVGYERRMAELGIEVDE